jgi:hypothetical protein
MHSMAIVDGCEFDFGCIVCDENVGACCMARVVYRFQSRSSQRLLDRRFIQ